jgi:hypothetical protein
MGYAVLIYLLFFLTATAEFTVMLSISPLQREPLTVWRSSSDITTRTCDKVRKLSDC